MLPDEGGDAELMAGIKRDLATINRLISETKCRSAWNLKSRSRCRRISPTYWTTSSRLHVPGGTADRMGGQPILHEKTESTGAASRRHQSAGECYPRYGEMQNRSRSNWNVTIACSQSGFRIRCAGYPGRIPAGSPFFAPFYRLEKSRSTTTGKGSGLGNWGHRAPAVPDANGWEG